MSVFGCILAVMLAFVVGLYVLAAVLVTVAGYAINRRK